MCRCALCAMLRLSSDHQCFGTDFHEDIPIFLAHSTVNKWVMLDVSQGSLCKLRHPTARNCVQINLHSAQHEISIVCH